MAGLNFNANAVAPMAPRGEPLPAGWYVVHITESELKPTSSGTGLRLNMTAEVLHSQEHADRMNGRKVWIGLNLKNDNPKAMEMAQEELSAICHAVGVMEVQDSQQLHRIPMWVRLKVVEAEGKYDAKNEITAYHNQTFVPPAPRAKAPGAPVATPTSAPAGFAAASTTAPIAPAGFAPAAQPPVTPTPAAPAAPAQPWNTAPAAPTPPAAPAAPAAGWNPPATTAPATEVAAEPAQLSAPWANA